MLTRHLSTDDIVRLAEQPGAGAGNAHLATCTACRRKVDELAEVLALVSASEVPEPSPLFWDRLSQRIDAAIDEARAGTGDTSRRSWLTPAWKVPAVVTASAALIALVVSLRVPERAATDLTLGGRGVVNDSAPVAAPDTDPGGWTFVETVASAVDADSAGVLTDQLAYRQAERLVESLSSDEQAELARLIQAELKDR